MNLPEFILEEILSRLPVKSLQRFRCVSSLFNCLICDPQFQNQHLRHALSCSSNLEYKRLLAYADYNLMVSCSLLSSDYNNAIAWRPCCVSDNGSTSFISATVHCSSVNGLFCVSLRPPLDLFGLFEISLWNPSMNELRRLPNSSLDLDEETCELEPFYGLGYDSANDDYIVVRLITKYFQYLEKGSIKVKVYSLRDDSWRSIQSFPYHTLSRGITYFNCQFVNRRFHWMVLCDTRGDGTFKWVIVSLNYSSDEYKDIPQPNYQKVLRTRDYIDIVVLDDLLCVYIHYFGGSFDLWTMKDYGVQQSWYMSPMYLFETGDVLFKAGTIEKQDIMIYKKDKKVFKPCFGRETTMSRRRFIYTETLISPNRYMTPAAS